MESQGRFVFLRDNFTQRLVGYLVREISVFYSTTLSCGKPKYLIFRNTILRRNRTNSCFLGI